MFEFTKDQIFIITGASSGIGKGVALLLNELGATVVAIARRMDKLEEIKASSVHPENFFCEHKDLSVDCGTLDNYVRSIKAKYGKLRGFVYCAGISSILPLQAITPEIVQEVFNINYFAPLFMAKGFADRRINMGKGSAMVFISSIAAECCDKGMSLYSGSKAALKASARVIAKEIAPNGVRVNSILPADIETPMTVGEYMQRRESLYPMGFGKTSDVANFVAFLLSDKAKWISGQSYIMDCAALL